MLHPIAQNKRDLSLDVLRGFALAGVLLIFCINDIGRAPGYQNTLLDDIIDWPKWILVENRMYTMLILVFGIGFHIQLEKAKKEDVSIVPVFTRRLLGLLILGFIHAVFLSNRDILMFYAIAGAALLFARNASNRQLMVLAILVFFLVITPAIQLLAGNPWLKVKPMVQPNNYPDHVNYNWQYFKVYHQVYGIYLDMLFHFLLGFWISRSGIFQKLKTNVKFRRRWMFIVLAGSAVLIPVYYFWFTRVIDGKVYGMENSLLKFMAVSGLRFVWQLWMMVSVTLYSTILISLAVSRIDKKWLRPLSAFGQMALSNYLIQSIVLVPFILLFDKFNTITPLSGFIVFLAMLAMQMGFSSWWLARFRLGPFEWLLRSITYLNWQPIKVNRPALQEL